MMIPSEPCRVAVVLISHLPDPEVSLNYRSSGGKAGC